MINNVKATQLTVVYCNESNYLLVNDKCAIIFDFPLGYLDKEY